MTDADLPQVVSVFVIVITIMLTQNRMTFWPCVITTMAAGGVSAGLVALIMELIG